MSLSLAWAAKPSVKLNQMTEEHKAQHILRSSYRRGQSWKDAYGMVPCKAGELMTS